MLRTHWSCCVLQLTRMKNDIFIIKQIRMSNCVYIYIATMLICLYVTHAKGNNEIPNYCNIKASFQHFLIILSILRAGAI